MNKQQIINNLNDDMDAIHNYLDTKNIPRNDYENNSLSIIARIRILNFRHF